MIWLQRNQHILPLSLLLLFSFVLVGPPNLVCDHYPYYSMFHPLTPHTSLARQFTHTYSTIFRLPLPLPFTTLYHPCLVFFFRSRRCGCKTCTREELPTYPFIFLSCFKSSAIFFFHLKATHFLLIIVYLFFRYPLQYTLTRLATTFAKLVMERQIEMEQILSGTVQHSIHPFYLTSVVW